MHRDLKPGNIMLTQNRRQAHGLRPGQTGESGCAFVGERSALVRRENHERGHAALAANQRWHDDRHYFYRWRPSRSRARKPTRARTCLPSARCSTRWPPATASFEGKSQISLASAILEKDPYLDSHAQPADACGI